MNVAHFHSTRRRLTSPAFVSQFARSRGYGFKQFDNQDLHATRRLRHRDAALPERARTRVPAAAVPRAGQLGQRAEERERRPLSPLHGARAWHQPRRVRLLLLVTIWGSCFTPHSCMPCCCIAMRALSCKPSLRDKLVRACASYQRLRCASGAARRAALRRCYTCSATSPRASTKCIVRGLVRRDLKRPLKLPGNALLMLHSQCWRLIDVGIAAEIGACCEHFAQRR